MKIKYSSSIMLVVAVFFFIHYCFTGYTSIYALECVVFTHFAVVFLQRYKEKRNTNGRWLYLFMGIVIAICAFINLVLYFK